MPGAITQFASYPTGSTNYGVDATAHASANTKGSWVAFTTGLPFAAQGLYVQAIRGQSSRKYLIDIGQGTVSAATVIIPNLYVALGDDVSAGGFLINVPLPLAPSTGLVGRIQCTTGGSTLRLAAYPYALDGLISSFTGAAALGVSTGTTVATTLDPGAVADAKGAYSTVGSPLAGACRALILRVGYQNTFPSFAQWKLDIAIGSPEVVVLGDLVFSTADLADGILPTQWEFPLALPASTQISMRAQCTITDATDRLIDVSLLAVTGTASAGATVPLGWMTPAVTMIPRR